MLEWWLPGAALAPGQPVRLAPLGLNRPPVLRNLSPHSASVPDSKIKPAFVAFETERGERKKAREREEQSQTEAKDAMCVYAVSLDDVQMSPGLFGTIRRACSSTH